MADQGSTSKLGSPVDSPGLQTTGNGADSTMPRAPEAPLVRSVSLPLYGVWKPVDSGGTVGKNSPGARKRGAGASTKGPAASPRPKTAPDGRKRKPSKLGDPSVGREWEAPTGEDESGTSLTGKPCLKRRREGAVLGGDLSPRHETLFPESASAARLENLPLLQPFLSLPLGWSPGAFVAGEATGGDDPSGTGAWCAGSQARRSVESTEQFEGLLGSRGTGSVGKGGLGQGEIRMRKEVPFGTSWPVELQFGPGANYPVLEERSGTTAAVSGANPPFKTGLREANPLHKDGVDGSHVGLNELKAGNVSYGVNDLTGKIDDLNASLTALLTDHMRVLLDDQEAQLGVPGSECPVELSPAQVAKIMEQQEQLRAALEFFKTLTGLDKTGLSPLTGANESPGQASLSGSQSCAPETISPGRRLSVGGGLRDGVSGQENGFSGELSAVQAEPFDGLERRVERAEGPVFVPLLYRNPLEVPAEPGKDTWQLEESCFGGEWSAHGRVAGPMWAPLFAEQVGPGSLF